MTWDLLVSIAMLPVTAAKQAGQIAGGIWKYVTRDAELSTFVPDWLLKLTIEAIPKAFAGDTPQDQIEGSIILIGWSIATSLFTGGVTLFFVLVFGFFLMIGLFRFSDWGSSAWDKVSSPSIPDAPDGPKRGSTRKRR